MFATNNSTEQLSEPIRFPVDHGSRLKLWSLLAFQAGWINGGGFLACKRFVTHTTGVVTQLGYDLASTKWSEALAMATIPFFFIAGAAIGALFADETHQRKESSRYHILFLINAVFLGLAAGLGYLGLFGTFGNEPQNLSSYLLVVLLCLSSGIQNAVSTIVSRTYIRTTHLTGYTTDLGISLVRIFSTKRSDEISEEKRQNKKRIFIILSFVFGTIASSFVFIKYEYLGFVIPSLVSAGLCIATYRRFKSHA